ncbi:MAG: creatininase family protein [Gemmatimonadota bacterium]
MDPGQRSNPPTPPRLTDLTWPEAAAWFRRDPRLILPVGTCLQHGPHLPLNADSLIVTAVAEAIAARHRVLIAPTLPFGAASKRDLEYAGTAALWSKTLHRVLNDLIAGWERHGVEEFILMTAQGFAPHFDAMLAVVSDRARIRAVDINSVDLSRFLSEPGIPEHAGELETSLILYLAPELVRREEIRDAPLPESELRRLTRGSEAMPPEGSAGVVGRPSRASAETGRRIYEYLVDYIGGRLFAEQEDGDAE